MRRMSMAIGAVLLITFCVVSSAQASFGLKDFSVKFEEEDHSPAILAGSHPFQLNTTFSVNTKIDSGSGEEIPDGDVKALRFQLPPGFVGSITAAPRCASVDFLTVDESGYPACPNDTAVGATQSSITKPGGALVDPIYNLVPPPGVAAKLGFIANQIPITIEVGVNGEAPNNLISGLLNIPQVTTIFGASVQIWGVPANSSHDPYRGRCLEIGSVANYGDLLSKGVCDTDASELAFLTLPRSCTGPLTSSYEATSWQEPNAAPDKGSDQAPELTDCAALGLFPRTEAHPSTASAESAAGLDFTVNLSNKGFSNPTERSSSDIKKAVVTLPAGMTVNPSSAAGLAVCSKAGYERESLASQPGEGCPEASKVGEVEVESPAVEGTIVRGSVFVASQDDNPFGTLVALYMVIREPELGVFVKLPIKVEPSEERGPNSGRLVATLEEAPQLPVSRFTFHFKEGARAPLVTPAACGTYTTDARLTSWANPEDPIPTTASFDIGSGVGGGPCPAGAPPFRPTFLAGSVDNAAGAYSPFDMRLTRQDGDQDITRLDAVLPKGLTAKLAGVTKCPESAIAVAKGKTARAELASPSCPPNSRIGETLAGAGVGGTLTYVPGQLYLGGPFAGDPLSVIAITPVVAGPFDVGTVVVHEALNVDPETAEVQIDGTHSDPLPHALRGIPAKLKDVRINTDRPNFALNPTSCATKQARATLFGSFLDVFNPRDDVPVTLSSRYQARGCSALKFRPHISLRLHGGVKRGAHPALKAVLTYPPGGGYANIASVVATLSHASFLDQSHIRTICTRVQFAAEQCPAGSIYGKARAIVPLFDEPFEGPVYLRSSSNPLPDLVVALHGPIDFNVVGRVDAVHARIRGSFESVPDAPVSKFVLELRGGKKGLFVNSRNICTRPAKGVVAFTAQNGKSLEQRPVVKADCKKKRSKRKRGSKK
jgi:hypothetical protein